MVVNKRELADILGRSARTLTEWDKCGMPVEDRATKRGKSNRYDTVEVISWMLRREAGTRERLDVEAERARLLAAQADKAEMERDRMRGELLERDVVLDGWRDVLARMRERLVKVHMRCPNKARRTVKKEVWGVLKDLAQGGGVVAADGVVGGEA